MESNICAVMCGVLLCNAQRVVGYSFWDQMKQFIVRDIQFSWNEPLHRLLVLGRDVKQNVFCGVYVDNPEEVLFNDGYVL